MKAYVRTNGKNMNVELTEMPIPEISADEVLVKIHALGVGIHDRYFIPQNAHFPYIIGTEASGVIENIGSDVQRFSVGDRVMLTAVLQPKGGCWAEYVAVPQKYLNLIPEHMNFTTAAGIPIAGNTALESMRALNLQSGNTLFIAGASGAIGTLVIQMASSQGIRVAGSASQRNHQYMQTLGAEKFVDYHDADWKEQVLSWTPGGVDAALAIQPGTPVDSMDVVKDGGTVVTVSGDPVPSERGIHVFQFDHHEDTRQKLDELARQIETGDIQLVLEQIYPFVQTIEALEKTETRHARGKLVVDIDL